MPLDPIFAERLRVHRRYLIGQALAAAKKRLTSLWPFAHALSAGTQKTRPDAAARPSRRPEAPDRTPAGPRARARAKHRRAALAWDRKELETVGTPGPDIRTREHVVDVPGLQLSCVEMDGVVVNGRENGRTVRAKAAWKKGSS